MSGGAESRDLDFLRWQALPGEVRQVAFAIGSAVDLVRDPKGDRALLAVGAIQLAEVACMRLEAECRDRSGAYPVTLDDRRLIAAGDVTRAARQLVDGLALYLAQLRRHADRLARAEGETEHGTKESGAGAAASSGGQITALRHHRKRCG